MRTPSRASISARRRAIVQFGRSATGSSSNGVITRNAASLFTGAGPGAMLAFSASTPPRPKSLRQSRTVSSRTPNASAIRGLVQPDSVSRTARARSASPRSRDPASAAKADRCSSLAATGDLPPMPHPSESMRNSESQHLSVGQASRNLLMASRAIATVPKSYYFFAICRNHVANYRTLRKERSKKHKNGTWAMHLTDAWNSRRPSLNE